MSVLFTVGYEGTDIERFIETLKHAGVETLADVRAVAVSRKKGFSKTKLAAALEDAGIRYQHFVKLGDPKPGREAARAGDFDLFETIYTDHLASVEAQEQLDQLRELVKTEATVLLCFERDPATCHRTIVADRICGTLGFIKQNLFADDPGRYVRNASKMPSFSPCESHTPAE